MQLQATISRVHVRKTRHAIRLIKRNRNVVISNVHLYQNTGIGLYLDDVDLHQINVGNSHIRYNLLGGIIVRGGNVRNLHVTGCDIEANMPRDSTPTESANLFIDCRESDRSVAEVAITGCTIQHSAHYAPQKQAPGGANIRILGRNDFKPNMITITGNVMSNTHTHVHLKQTADITVIGNSNFTTKPTDILVEDSERITIANLAIVSPSLLHAGACYSFVGRSNLCLLPNQLQVEALYECWHHTLTHGIGSLNGNLRGELRRAQNAKTVTLSMGRWVPYIIMVLLVVVGNAGAITVSRFS